MINGSRPANPSGDEKAQLNGIFKALANPTAAPSAVANFDAFAAAHAGGIDGLWSNTLKDVGIVCGPATMALAARTFQTAASFKGEMSAAAYAMAQTGGFWTNKRMPDAETFMTVERRAAGHPVPHGPVDDGRLRGDDYGDLPPLGRNFYR